MKKRTLNLFSLLILTFVFVACNKTESIQEYYINSKEDPNFISVDVPASILQLKDNNISSEAKNTLKTIKKINFLGLKLADDNRETYVTEKEKLKKVLKNSDYKDLMRFKHGKSNIRISYLGEEDAIDEVLVFAFDNEKGLALARLLGENMNLAQLVKIIDDIKTKKNSKELGSIIDFMTKKTM